MSDESIELPEGWERTKLKQVTEIVMGQSPPGDSYNQNGIGTPLINGPVEFGGSSPFARTIQTKFTTSPTKLCREGDLILCVRGSTTGRMNISGFTACIGRGVAALQAHIYQEYLNFFIHFIQQDIYRLGTGSTFPNVSADILNEILISVPPIAEQTRIVAKIEELRSRTQKAREALETIPQMCDRFRQSVLAAAFRGALTADWREENANAESTKILLDRISDNLSKTKGIKASEKLPDPFEIPKDWKWSSLSEICYSITDGDHQPPPKSDIGIPFLTISNISSGKFDFSNTRFVPEAYYEKIQEQRKAKKGDILYSVVGSYGVPVLVDSEDRFCFQRHIAILKPHNLIISQYLLYALKAGFVFNQATEVATGTAQLTVTLSGLRRIRVPITSEAEQELIVERLEKVLAAIDRIQQQYEDAKARLEKLDRAILAKAFRGELVPQDPNDEPASVLLDRIREERSKKSDRSSIKRKRT